MLGKSVQTIPHSDLRNATVTSRLASPHDAPFSHYKGQLFLVSAHIPSPIIVEDSTMREVL